MKQKKNIVMFFGLLSGSKKMTLELERSKRVLLPPGEETGQKMNAGDQDKAQAGGREHTKMINYNLKLEFAKRLSLRERMEEFWLIKLCSIRAVREHIDRNS